MLVTNDSSLLGDKRLNPEEGLIKLKEENRALAAKKKIQGQDELENVERSAGQRMAWQELIRRIRLCNYSIQFLDGSPGNIAVYALKTRKELEESEYDDTKSEFFNDHKYVSGFPKEPMPEYSHITVDERGLPKREIRGWRSVLIALITNHVISYRDAVKHFGEATGQHSARWHEQLRDLK